MDWQMILFSVCIVPSKVLGENLERPLISVDVIHLPYKPNYQYTRYDSSVLSVELKDQQNFTVCFAAMLEAFSDARGNLDRTIFNSILKAISIRFDFATSAKDLFLQTMQMDPHLHIHFIRIRNYQNHNEWNQGYGRDCGERHQEDAS